MQEIKILRSNVSQREREKAERATLVTQERLVKSKVRISRGPCDVPLDSTAFDGLERRLVTSASSKQPSNMSPACSIHCDTTDKHVPCLGVHRK